MIKREEYKIELRKQLQLETYLKSNSNLPGPRSNLELLYAFTEVSNLADIENLLNKETAPAENTPEIFPICCSVAALGRHIQEVQHQLIAKLKEYASSYSWRVRESTAMALQYIGKKNPDLFIKITSPWLKGNAYEKRALAAGICEPALLVNPLLANFSIEVLNNITFDLTKEKNRKDERFKTLRQALGYCWSLAIVANPEKGIPEFEKLSYIDDNDIKWIIKENLKKKRLGKLGAQWNNRLHLINRD